MEQIGKLKEVRLNTQAEDINSTIVNKTQNQIIGNTEEYVFDTENLLLVDGQRPFNFPQVNGSRIHFVEFDSLTGTKGYNSIAVVFERTTANIGGGELNLAEIEWIGKIDDTFEIPTSNIGKVNFNINEAFTALSKC